jgi:hypothetical protein
MPRLAHRVACFVLDNAPCGGRVPVGSRASARRLARRRNVTANFAGRIGRALIAPVGGDRGRRLRLTMRAERPSTAPAQRIVVAIRALATPDAGLFG